jgi:CTD kinase subunit beta
MDRQCSEGTEIVGTFIVERRNADMSRPVRTFDTAVIYYHKFRLVHADTEYSYAVSMASGSFCECN